MRERSAKGTAELKERVEAAVEAEAEPTPALNPHSSFAFVGIMRSPRGTYFWIQPNEIDLFVSYPTIQACKGRRIQLTINTITTIPCKMRETPMLRFVGGKQSSRLDRKT